MAKVQSLTSLAASPEAARRKRMTRYLIAMTIRVICLISAFFVTGPLMILCFAGAILLPYFAVVDANAGAQPSKDLAMAESATKSLPQGRQGESE